MGANCCRTVDSPNSIRFCCWRDSTLNKDNSFHLFNHNDSIEQVMMRRQFDVDVIENEDDFTPRSSERYIDENELSPRNSKSSFFGASYM